MDGWKPSESRQEFGNLPWDPFWRHFERILWIRKDLMTLIVISLAIVCSNAASICAFVQVKNFQLEVKLLKYTFENNTETRISHLPEQIAF